MKYQVGSGNVSGQGNVILHARGRYLKLNELLRDSQITKKAGLNDIRGSVDLVRMMEEWPYWEKKLPDLIEYAFENSEKHELSGEILESDIGWLPPLMYPRKLIFIGTNYKDHIAEMGLPKLPEYPYSFLKPPTTTLVGSGETVDLPEQANLVDWEAELAVIIGQRVRGVRGEEAMNAVAGYSTLNDLSARDWIADAPPVGIDWVMQKAFDGFTPMGPFITPAEFVPEPQNLPIRLTVNGEVKQDSNTANMVFSVMEVVEHLAGIMTLEPGDVIATGTPAGVGYGMRPRQFLKSGDLMSVEIEGLGTLETYVR